MHPEEIFRDRLKEVLSDHYPNEDCVDKLSSYIFTIAMESLANSGLDRFDKDGIQEFVSSYEGESIISPMDKMTLKKSLRDIAVFVSQNIMMETVKGVFSQIKNSVPLASMVKREFQSDYTKIPKTSKVGYSANEMDFDEMDLDDIPKVDVKRISESLSVEREYASNEFEGDFDMDFDEINRGIKNQSSNMRSRDLDFRGNESYEEEIGSDVPKVSINLDY